MAAREYVRRAERELAINYTGTNVDEIKAAFPKVNIALNDGRVLKLSGGEYRDAKYAVVGEWLIGAADEDYVRTLNDATFKAQFRLATDAD